MRGCDFRVLLATRAQRPANRSIVSHSESYRPKWVSVLCTLHAIRRDTPVPLRPYSPETKGVAKCTAESIPSVPMCACPCCFAEAASRKSNCHLIRSTCSPGFDEALGLYRTLSVNPAPRNCRTPAKEGQRLKDLKLTLSSALQALRS